MFIRITPSVAVGNETRVLHKNGVHASYGHTDIPWDLPNSSRAPPPKERPLHLYISGLTPLSAILLSHRRYHQCRWHHSSASVTVTNAICMRIRPQTDSLFLYLLTINQSSPLDFCAWRKATSTMSHPVVQIKLRGINCQPIPERIQIIITEQLPCFMKDLSLTMNTWIPGYGPLGQLSDHRQHTEVCMYTCNRRFETLHGPVIVRPAVPF